MMLQHTWREGRQDFLALVHLEIVQTEGHVHTAMHTPMHTYRHKGPEQQQ